MIHLDSRTDSIVHHAGSTEARDEVGPRLRESALMWKRTRELSDYFILKTRREVYEAFLAGFTVNEIASSTRHLKTWVRECIEAEGRTEGME